MMLLAAWIELPLAVLPFLSLSKKNTSKKPSYLHQKVYKYILCMRRILHVLFIINLFGVAAMAQVNLTPTVSPASFNSQEEITIEYDVTGTALASLEEAYIWVWVPGSEIDAKYNVNPASSNATLTANARFSKTEANNKVLFSITFTPEQFFAQPICLESKLGMLIKGNDWSNGQSNDFVLDMTPLTTCYVVKLITPTDEKPFVAPGGDLHVQAESSDPSTFTMFVDGQQVAQQTDREYFSYHYTVLQDEGTYPVELLVNDVENDTTITFSYLVNTPSEVLVRPQGIVAGINYDQADDTKATLCLLAPGKDAVYALGEFNNFELLPENKMKRDGDYFWMEISGLEAGKEYAFQYLVDGVYVADPFAEKILDPDDAYIPEEIYPNLKAYPVGQVKNEWHKNRMSVLQTAQPEFTWQNPGFQRLDKADLVIYEVLVRDFFAEKDRNYENLIDTLSYLKKLGVNAIELMPIQEFSGNNSWGYNPNFMFAPDKAYGTEEDLKKFIDAAHGEGIAVILDIVFNQQEVPNPFVAMWYDFKTNKATSDNPMFNVEATHPFNVFIDMNHESELTQFYMDTTLHYWSSQYKVDGYRFDLSKGFTQTKYGGDVGKWSSYDQGRIDLLKRMYDKVREYDADSYLILEHLGDNSEETVLADHGFMLWGNMHFDYKDLLLGIEKNIAWGSHDTRGWQQPNLVTYIESHDEQRLMYELLNYGKSEGSYDTRKKSTAIRRLMLANALFYTIPGAKMLWQFGEFAYEDPINLCSDGVRVGDGTDCRTDPKPTRWELLNDPDREKLRAVVSSLIKLKTDHQVFKTGDFSITNGNGFVKEVVLANKDGISQPTNKEEMSVYVVGNFDLKPQNLSMQLPFSGTWYDFFNGGEELEANSTNVPIELTAGEFKVLVNFEIDFPEIELDAVVAGAEDIPNVPHSLSLYPNPGRDFLNYKINMPQEREWKVEISDMSGRVLQELSQREFQPVDISGLGTGLYLFKVYTSRESFTSRFLKI